jgi:hypothetical protein
MASSVQQFANAAEKIARSAGKSLPSKIAELEFNSSQPSQRALLWRQQFAILVLLPTFL